MEYKKGIYSVFVSEKDGSIKVKRNDWISKYSAAIYNDFTRLTEFGRINGDSSPVLLENPDQIFEGEVIYHLPTYSSQKQPGNNQPTKNKKLVAKKILTEKDKQLIVDTLRNDFKLRGNNIRTLRKAIDIIGHTDNALALIELSGLLEGAVVGTTASTISFISTFLFPVAGLGMLKDANEIGFRFYGLRAVAYTITAWAFDRPIPVGSNRIMSNMRGLPVSKIAKYKRAWFEASQATLHYSP